MGSDVFARAFRVVVQAHQNHRVEGIDRRHQKRFGVPVVVRLAERL